MSPDALDAAFLKGLDILLVEDDDLARDHLATALRRRVGTVATAADGAAGLEAFREGRHRILLTDIQMPGMDGLTMVQAIRALDPRVPVIVLTAFEQTDYMARAIDLGINHFIIKPIQLDRLDAALLRCARGLRSEEEMHRRQELEVELVHLRHQEALALLLGGIAHDCNNLLQAILSTMTLATMKLPPGSEAQEVLDLGRGSVEEAKVLGRRLQALANPPRDKDRLGPVEPLVLQVVQKALQGSPCVAAFQLEAGEPAIRHHEATLAQALRTLADNAREAMAGGGTLTVAAARRRVQAQEGLRLAEGDYLHLAFRDEGRGIAPEHLPMIFEPYFTTKERDSHRGTGLGLALAERIIQVHGGAIQVESQPGEGSTFHVYLPLD